MKAHLFLLSSVATLASAEISQGHPEKPFDVTSCQRKCQAINPKPCDVQRTCFEECGWQLVKNYPENEKLKSPCELLRAKEKEAQCDANEYEVTNSPGPGEKPEVTKRKSDCQQILDCNSPDGMFTQDCLAATCAKPQHKKRQECLAITCKKDQHQFDTDCLNLTCAKEENKFTSTCLKITCSSEETADHESCLPIACADDTSDRCLPYFCKHPSNLFAEPCLKKTCDIPEYTNTHPCKKHKKDSLKACIQDPEFTALEKALAESRKIQEAASTKAEEAEKAFRAAQLENEAAKEALNLAEIDYQNAKKTQEVCIQDDKAIDSSIYTETLTKCEASKLILQEAKNATNLSLTEAREILKTLQEPLEFAEKQVRENAAKVKELEAAQTPCLKSINQAKEILDISTKVHQDQLKKVTAQIAKVDTLEAAFNKATQDFDAVCCKTQAEESVKGFNAPSLPKLAAPEVIASEETNSEENTNGVDPQAQKPADTTTSSSSDAQALIASSAFALALAYFTC